MPNIFVESQKGGSTPPEKVNRILQKRYQEIFQNIEKSLESDGIVGYDVVEIMLNVKMPPEPDDPCFPSVQIVSFSEGLIKIRRECYP